MTERSPTDPQRQALTFATDRGYFNTLGDVTMVELGEERVITQQAVASSLRRGIDQIPERALTETDEPG